MIIKPVDEKLYQDLVETIKLAFALSNDYRDQDSHAALSNAQQIVTKIEEERNPKPVTDADRIRRAIVYLDSKQYLMDAFEKDEREYDTKHYVQVIWNIRTILTAKDLM